MNKYHMRKSEKAITDQNKMWEIIHNQLYMTLSMCKDNEPYLVTVNYAFDQRRNCFYFHCAEEGKKMDYLKANPTVWGQILDDRGYMHGECDHAYRTIHFKGTASKVTDIDEKRYALHLMIEQLENDPEPMKQKFIETSSFQHTAIIRVQIQGMTGKASPAI